MGTARRILSTIILFLTLPNWTYAQSSMLAAELTAYRVKTQEDGKEYLTLAQYAQPGDLIEYRVVYSNRSKKTMHAVAAVLPIPAQAMTYLKNSAHPSSVEASLDGKHFESTPLKRVVVLPNGSREVQEVPLEEYRYLRWNIGDLGSGKSTTVRARVRVVAQ